MLQARHERHPGGSRGENRQCRPHRRIPDGVDLRRNSGRGRPAGQLGEALGLGDPDAPPALLRQRPVRFGLDVLEQGCGTRTQGTVGEALQPSDPCQAGRLASERRAAPETVGDCRIEGIVAQRHVDPQRQPSRLR